MVEAALGYMATGWPVFPVDGKEPANTHGVLEASTEDRLAAIWWERHPGRGVALATGTPSGVWVLDLDGEEAKTCFLGLQEKHGKIPATVASRTARGFHLFFAMPEEGDVRNSAAKVAPGIDVRGTGGYVVLPPSPHPSGTAYKWLDGRAPEQCPVAAAPRWLLELVSKREAAVSAAPVGDSIIQGGRNQTLISLAGSMRRRGMARDSILAALRSENETRCRPPLDDSEVVKIADSAARYEPTTPPVITIERSSAPEITHPVVEGVDWDLLQSIATEKSAPIDAVPTPWPRWNRACYGAGGGEGLARGWHIVVGASSGAGKSLAATNIAASAIKAGHQVCMLSLEMTRTEILTRLLAILTDTPVRSLEHGHCFSRPAWEKASEQLLESAGAFRVNDRPLSSLTEVREAMNREAGEGTRIVIVDYLQLAWVSNADTLFNQITEVSRTVQMLAKDHKITTIGISQVNRRTSAGDTLKKEGLMGGSSLENDAEQVVLLGAPKREPYGLVSEVTLDKNRHGPNAEWKMKLDTTTLRMTELL